MLHHNKNTHEGVFDRLLKLVQQLGKSLHEISDEITAWRKILEVPYQEYLLGKPYELAAMLPAAG